MRRKDRERGRDFALDVIDRCEYGVAAFAGAEGPYAVPLSFVRVGDALYFHCALEGTKLDLLRRDGRVCITFVTGTEPYYDPTANSYSTIYQSAVVNGTAFEVAEPERKTAILRALCEKLTPDAMDGYEAAAARSLPATAVWGVRIEAVTGKEKSRKPRTPSGA